MCVCPYTYMPLFFCLSLSIHLYLSISLLSLSLSFSLSLSLCLSACLPGCLSVCLSACRHVCRSVCLSVCPCLCISVCVHWMTCTCASLYFQIMHVYNLCRYPVFKIIINRYNIIYTYIYILFIYWNIYMCVFIYSVWEIYVGDCKFCTLVAVSRSKTMQKETS